MNMTLDMQKFKKFYPIANTLTPIDKKSWMRLINKEASNENN